MKMNRSLRKLLSTIGTIVVVAIAAYLKSKDEGQGSGGQNLPPVNIPAASGETQNGYTLLDGCRLIEERGNDGDSFLLKTSTGERLHLRLYFADCPEKYRHQHNGDRIQQQGEYFGGLSENQTIQAGQDAKALALKLLRAGQFQVATKWEGVFGNERHYGFVRFRTGQENGKYLSEILFREGLARFKTSGSNLPDGRRSNEYKRHLQKLEQQAKQQKRGAWGMRS